MWKNRLPPDVTSYNAAISSCEKIRFWELGLHFLEECEFYARPDTISYSAAISNCEKGGQWQRAHALLKTMCEVKVRPDIACYSAAISSCENGGRCLDALQGVFSHSG